MGFVSQSFCVVTLASLNMPFVQGSGLHLGLCVASHDVTGSPHSARTYFKSGVVSLMCVLLRAPGYGSQVPKSYSTWNPLVILDLENWFQTSNQ